MTMTPLHPGNLFHIGVVAADIDEAMPRMTRDLGLIWRGGGIRQTVTVLHGQERPLAMRIAFSAQGPPHVELIQAVPDTPWEAASAGIHHLCYWSETPEADGEALIRQGSQRILGRPGGDANYYEAQGGFYIEIISTRLRDKMIGIAAGEIPTP